MHKYLSQLLAECAFWRSAYVHAPNKTYLFMAKTALKRARLANLSIRNGHA